MSGRKRTDGLSGETEDEVRKLVGDRGGASSQVYLKSLTILNGLPQDGVADQHLKNKGEVCDPVSSHMAIDAGHEPATPAGKPCVVTMECRDHLFMWGFYL